MTPILHRQVMHHATATFVFRGLVLGLLGAIALLLALPRHVRPRATRAVPGATIVDVSQARAGDSVVSVLGLLPGERVVAIDDRPGTTDDVVGAWRGSAPGRYLDLTVAGPGGAPHRLLVIVHR